ncbi:SCP2 sterol-binding domain-containing protein [Palleronia caenipelagi]|uniref:SCP2 sterol-binding domain-containing protein n=1 Tax=Palleronia caenipelagi TaxID=2489174 RepID=A0A547Q374_9RHOB|nr:SCP2 sterol-binding domain-containing protein [Palleronia caenipelagi]TRD20821.1 SCP2 sterol-binding domain-containing protein [Palleronia caenipelagi]
MSTVIEEAAAQLNEKVGGSFDGSLKFVVEGEGAIMLDGAGARVGDEPADTTMTADAETFQALAEGTLDPTSAFMSGRLKIDGDMAQAMKLATSF